MAQVGEVSCTNESANDMVNPVLSMTAQVSAILFLSHLFQLVLKPLGQPGPLAQILAGLVLGPTGLSNFESVHKFFFQNFATDYYESMALYCRIGIMFLIGLEMDVPYLLRNFKRACGIALGGCVITTIFAAAITDFIYQESDATGSKFLMGLMITVVLANTGSPIVFRLAADLKFATTDLGRMAISSSLTGDMYAVFILIIVSGQKRKNAFGKWVSMGFSAFTLVVIVIVVNMYLTNWLNRRNRNQKSLKILEVLSLYAILVATSMGLESMGFSSIIACFIIGSMFPKGGKAARTILSSTTYMVHNFVFPIYFGYMGFKADMTIMKHIKLFGLVVMIVLLSIGGKISGTLAACHYSKTPLNEGVLLAFLMNLKGHVDILTLTTGMQNRVVSSPHFYDVMISAVVLSSLISTALIGFLVRRESDTLGYRHIPLEVQNPETELRLLSCVHGPRPVSTLVGLIVSLRGSENVPISPYLMHLIELPERGKSTPVYHRRDRDQDSDDEFSDEEDYGGNDAIEINEAVDIFTAETKMLIHQVKTVCPYSTMHEEVCEFAEDVRASMIILPFHKHQRIDGKLENGKEGIRSTNQRVLRHAKCSVAILVDRGHTARITQAPGSDSLHHVATLFFGGPDDREALGFSKRLGTFHHINLTIIRFLPMSEKGRRVGVDVAQNAEDILMAISDRETENDQADAASIMDFYSRYVTSGKVGFVEKYVENGEETAMALRDMADMYSLFIVGKGGRGHSPLTTGMSDWEECPELGTVGDFLASSEFDISGSVLVFQQHRASQCEDDNRYRRSSM